MIPERPFLTRLQQVHEAHAARKRDPSPVQIQNFVAEQGVLQRLADETGITDTNLLRELFYKHGRVDEKKLNTFLGELEEIEKSCDETEFRILLMSLDERCVKPDGKINQRKLRKSSKKSKKDR